MPEARDKKPKSSGVHLWRVSGGVGDGDSACGFCALSLPCCAFPLFLRKQHSSVAFSTSADWGASALKKACLLALVSSITTLNTQLSAEQPNLSQGSDIADSPQSSAVASPCPGHCGATGAINCQAAERLTCSLRCGTPVEMPSVEFDHGIQVRSLQSG